MITRRQLGGLAALGAEALAAGSGVRAQGRLDGGVPAPPGSPSLKPVDPAEQRRRLMDRVSNWGYQLRMLHFPAIAASPLDLVVIDHALSAGRRFVHQFAPEVVELAARKPDGGRRLVLAYMSIGEAERYRFYWDQKFYEPQSRPAWLGAPNPQWDGNFLARFWHPDWQRLFLDGPDSYLARVQSAGFDGVYLDRADVHGEWVKEQPDAEALMVRFIERIAAVARERNPRFLVVMQNAEELLAKRSVLAAIDAIAKEDLFYGIDHNETRNDAATVADSLKLLRLAKRAGRRVLVVEYLTDAAKARDARRRAEQEGFLIHFTRRDLGDLSLVAPDSPGPSATQR